MDEQSPVTQVRRRRSREEMEQLVAEHEASGLSCAEFCRRRGMSLATLGRYRKRQVQGKAEPGSGWVAVEVSGAGSASRRKESSGLVVALPGGRRIEVGKEFDAHTLEQLVSVLERVAACSV